MGTKPLAKLIAIVGPTASGKTDLALALAKRYGGEVISADSRQFYRGTGIGSGVVAGEWTVVDGRRTYVAEGVPHYLVDFLSPNKVFTVAEFKAHVVKIARDIVKRGHVPILVGGTGLFVQAVVDNFLMPEVAPDEVFRARMEKRSTEVLYKELLKKDPVYAGRIPFNNRRYITRALEVMRATGKAFSSVQTKGEPLFEVLRIGVKREREEVNARIDKRVDAMMRAGLLEETRVLGKKYGWDAPAATGLGHRQLGMFLRGEIALEEAVALVKQETKRYVKRQMTWFKRDEKIIWVSGGVEGKKVAIGLVKAFLK